LYGCISRALHPRRHLNTLACAAAPIYSTGNRRLYPDTLSGRVRVPVPSYFENVPPHVTGAGWSGRSNERTGAKWISPARSPATQGRSRRELACPAGCLRFPARLINLANSVPDLTRSSYAIPWATIIEEGRSLRSPHARARGKKSWRCASQKSRRRNWPRSRKRLTSRRDVDLNY
jgi:hypothetical protein